MKSTTDRTSTKVRILGALVALAWVVMAIDTFIYHHDLLRFGIVARNPIGLRGILFAPFLHFNYQRLFIDTIAFALLGWLVMKQAIANFTIVSIICSVVGGVSIWLTGRAEPVYYSGAGSLICGYASYLTALGYFDRRLRGDGFAVAYAVGIWMAYFGRVMARNYLYMSGRRVGSKARFQKVVDTLKSGLCLNRSGNCDALSCACIGF